MSDRAGPGKRPRYVKEDFKTVASKIRYDLTAAQAKLTELMRMLASIELPTKETPFNEERALAFVRRTAPYYTDSSLGEELTDMGADEDFVRRALLVAADVRIVDRAQAEVEGYGGAER
jgi:hypothetical protein